MHQSNWSRHLRTAEQDPALPEDVRRELSAHRGWKAVPATRRVLLPTTESLRSFAAASELDSLNSALLYCSMFCTLQRVQRALRSPAELPIRLASTARRRRPPNPMPCPRTSCCGFSRSGCQQGVPGVKAVTRHEILSKFPQMLARFRLCRHRSLQPNTRFSAFFKIY